MNPTERAQVCRYWTQLNLGFFGDSSALDPAGSAATVTDAESAAPSPGRAAATDDDCCEQGYRNDAIHESSFA